MRKNVDSDLLFGQSPKETDHTPTKPAKLHGSKRSLKKHKAKEKSNSMKYGKL